MATKHTEHLDRKIHELEEQIRTLEEENRQLRLEQEGNYAIPFTNLAVCGAASNFSTLSATSIRAKRASSLWTACPWALELALLLNGLQPDNDVPSRTQSVVPKEICNSPESTQLDGILPAWEEMLVGFRAICLCIGHEPDGPYYVDPNNQTHHWQDNFEHIAETTLTGLFSFHISSFLGIHRKPQGLSWLHQAPTRHDPKAKLDGVLLLKTDETKYHIPILFLEMVVKGSAVKKVRAKCFVLASKMLTCSTKVLLGCIISLPPTPWKEKVNVWYELRLYCRPSFNPQKLADILLDKGTFDFNTDGGVRKFAQLLACSDVLRNRILGVLEREDLPAVHPRGTVLHRGRFGYKTFRIDKLSTQQQSLHGVVASERDWTLDCTWMPNCHILVQNETVTAVLLRYDWMEGTHVATHSTQFEHVLEHLSKLHDAGIVHGDIRLSNIVFCTSTPGSDHRSSESALIDFDISGRSKTRLYPANFNTSVGDGVRHQFACAGKQLLPQHDLFSMAEVMKFFYPTDITKRQQWAKVIELLLSLSSKAGRQTIKNVILLLKEIDVNLDCQPHIKQNFQTQQFSPNLSRAVVGIFSPLVQFRDAEKSKPTNVGAEKSKPTNVGAEKSKPTNVAAAQSTKPKRQSSGSARSTDATKKRRKTADEDSEYVDTKGDESEDNSTPSEDEQKKPKHNKGKKRGEKEGKASVQQMLAIDRSIDR